MRQKAFATILFVALLIHSPPLWAKESGFLGLSLGYFNGLDGEDDTSSFRAEYRLSRSVVFKRLKPWLGLELTPDKSAWLGAGLLYNFNLTPKIFITPSFGAGVYAHGSDGVDLGHPIIFRSQLEVSYALENKSRISLAISHLSNASLGRENPGAEILSVYYSIPLENLFSPTEEQS